jgi:L-fucose isomerase-like protein
MKPDSQVTLGVIFGNREFFPDHLVTEARRDIGTLLGREGVRALLVDEQTTHLGGVQTYADAEACADLFRKHEREIHGVLVCLPNFGDEKAVVDTLRMSGLNVPVLVHAYPDSLDRLSPATRRDAFCGKISVCNNLEQRAIPFSLTSRHTVHPDDPSFTLDLQRFVAVCRVVAGIRGLRVGAVGARPGAFNTVRYSEKILDRAGINVSTVDLSEILGAAERYGRDAAEVKTRVEEMTSFLPAPGVPDDRLAQMARLDLALRDWMGENRIDATAIQCWTSVQQNWGCNVCTSMSMMSESYLPSACEVDVTGVVTMVAMQLACGSPSALVDWNNNYADDPDRCVLFHCGNWAKSFIPGGAIANAPILGSTLGVENTYGALAGRTPAGTLTYGRITTSDAEGVIRAYVGEGQLTNDPLETFGTYAVAVVPRLQDLMQYVCKHGFEHHVAMTQSHSAAVLHEAFSNYLGWDTYWHA